MTKRWLVVLKGKAIFETDDATAAYARAGIKSGDPKVQSRESWEAETRKKPAAAPVAKPRLGS